VEAVGIVASRYQQGTSNVGADAFASEQSRCGGADELLQVPIECLDLGTELAIADGEPFQGQLGCCHGGAQRGPCPNGPERRGTADQYRQWHPA
jgi:hypothetical protein